MCLGTRIGLAMLLLGTAATGAAGSIGSMILTTTLDLPQPLENGSSSWCTWSQCFLGPRLYLAPRSDGTYLVGWTDSGGTGHVSSVADSSITSTHSFEGKKLRGLVTHGDGTYAVLLKEGVTLFLSKRSANGAQIWITNLNSTYAEDSSPLGDHRLAYGDGRYAAYWAVHSHSGHEGDQLRYVDNDGALVSGGWTWGCSHSMAELVGYHPGDRAFTNFCSTDCYPDPPGLKMNYATTVQPADGNCSGLGSLQLGQMAAAATGWKVVFNAQDTDASEAYGIGLATAGGSAATSVVWLTSTDGTNERDPVLARIGSAIPERYLIGWRTQYDGLFHIGIIDGEGVFLEGPEGMDSQGPGWGRRDDSFQSTPGGAVSWLEGGAGSSTLKIHTYVGEMIFADGFESNSTNVWSFITH